MVKANFTLKSVWQCCLGLLLMLAVPLLGTAQTLTFDGAGGLAIPPVGTGGFPCSGGPTVSTATCSLSGIIGTTATIDMVELDITHTFDSDIEATLISPAGTTLDLTSDNGGSGDNYTGTVFVDGAPNITTGTAPFTGMFQAEGGTFATTFAGEEINGDWTLEICDDAGGDTGTLNSFSITMTADELMPPTSGTQCGTGSAATPIQFPGPDFDADNDNNGLLSEMASFSTDVAGIPAGANVTNITINLPFDHTWVGDLVIAIQVPDGTVVPVMNRPGTMGSDFGDSSDANVNASMGGLNFFDDAPTDAEDMGVTIGDGQVVGADDGLFDYFPNGDGMNFTDAPGAQVATFGDLYAQGAGLNGTWTVYFGDTFAAFDDGVIYGMEVCVDYEATSGLVIIDPCDCNDDSSPIDGRTGEGGDDGTFSETVGVLNTNVDQVFEVVLIQGTDDIAVGDQLTFVPADADNPDRHEISFNHVDRVGYTIQVQQLDAAGAPVGDVLEIGNVCAYPDPIFDPLLDEFYCSFQGAIALGADDVDGIGGMATFTINGDDATEFDPEALGAGEYTVEMTFVGNEGVNDFGDDDDSNDLDFPGCTQVVTLDVIVTDLNLGCIGNINVTLGEDCGATITPEMVFTGDARCVDDFRVTVDGTQDNKIIGCGDHTYMIEAIVEDEVVYTCWGNILAEDKTPPAVECPEDTETAQLTMQVQISESSIDGTEPTLVLDNHSCFQNFFDPTAGTPYNYDLYTFEVSNTDVYNFLVDFETGSGVIALFSGGDFDPEDPCENVLGGSDGAYAIVDFFGVQFASFFNQNFRLPLALEAGRTYTLMVANDGALTDYTVGVVSDNGSTISGAGFGAPEPVVVEVPLYCEDVDVVSFNGQETFVVDANGNLDENSISEDLRRILFQTGFPLITDNCGDVQVTVFDEEDPGQGDCGDIVITRTFIISDHFGDNCTNGEPFSMTCTQQLTLTRPSLQSSLFEPNPQLVLPPLTAVVECDENFDTDGPIGGPDDNPAAQFSGIPFILTAAGYVELDQVYCNLGASYSDEPRIVVCDGSYKFRREWNLQNWCDPTENFVYDQYIKVGDFTGPQITGVNEVTSVSTTPFSCTANVQIPVPNVTDANGCSDAFPTTYEILAFGETLVATGNIIGAPVFEAPVGEHTLVLCAEDDCGNETCEEYVLIVEDNIEPTASCNDALNVSIGGGDIANDVFGTARIFAEDVDEGSNDNCSDVRIEIRRNFWRNDDCDPSPNRWSPWGDFVDFYCCDIDNEITIELRVWDDGNDDGVIGGPGDNSNICWLTVVPEDKLNPFCVAPDDEELTCAELPEQFPGNVQDAYDNDFNATSQLMNSLFGSATGTDNCAVDTIVERTPNVAVNECGWGTITRRFEVWQLRPDADVSNGIQINEVFRSTNSCSQVITITEIHDFVIDFPEDADAVCQEEPTIPTVETSYTGCDILSVNIGEPVRFNATSDECYKVSITYDVINWCVWDGEYTGYVIPRLTEDDGEALSVDRAVECAERPVVRVNAEGDADGNIEYNLCIDRNHDCDGDSSLPNCESPVLPNYGRYIYTQFIKVYDDTAPVVEVGDFGGPTDLCPDLLPGQFGDGIGDCDAEVSIPFSLTDDCGSFDMDGNSLITILSADVDAFAVDLNGDGTISFNEFSGDFDVQDLITDNGDGTFVFAGEFPIITTDMGENIIHALRITFVDGCGNQSVEFVEFDVVDCKGPAPICINGLTVTLMPQEPGTDADGDGDEDACAMAIWASDFEGSPIYDCTGQGPETNEDGALRVIEYAIYRAADVDADPDFVPNPDDTGLVLTQDDDPSTVVYVYAFDNDGQYDFCETYVLVQQHIDCGAGTGTLNGAIATEDSEMVEGVEVSVNGGVATMVTTEDGLYTFELAEGGDYTILPYLNAEPLNGVSTFDLVLMSKHILGVQPLATPYKRIAADINRSGSISTLDMIQLRKLILNIDTEFQNNTSWRFVDAAYEFPQPENPWAEIFPELINENNLVADVVGLDFVAVKIGDVNGSAQANSMAADNRTLNGTFNFDVEDMNVKAGNVYTVSFRGADMATVEGFQATLQLRGAELVDVEYAVATAENFGVFAEEGLVTASWNGKATAQDVLFSLVIRPTEDAQLSDVLSVNSRYTEAEAYGNGNTMNVDINFNTVDLAAAFELYQNTPNPFASETMIGFNLPQDADVTLTISDASGRVLTVRNAAFVAGYNMINVTKEMVNGATGVLTYTITAGEYTATKTMVAVK